MHAAAAPPVATLAQAAKPAKKAQTGKGAPPEGIAFTGNYSEYSHAFSDGKTNMKALLGNKADKFGGTIADFGKLIGAVDGSTIDVEGLVGGRVRIKATHDALGITQTRTIFRNGSGELEIHNDYFRADGAPAGTGVNVFARQVAAARKLGINKISVDATGSPTSDTYNGYYTWPRFGYDRPLYHSDLEHAPSSLQGAHTMQELFAKPGGAQWWKDHGSGSSLTFNLAADSVSSTALAKYVKYKGYKIKGITT